MVDRKDLEDLDGVTLRVDIDDETGNTIVFVFEGEKLFLRLELTDSDREWLIRSLAGEGEPDNIIDAGWSEKLP